MNGDAKGKRRWAWAVGALALAGALSVLMGTGNWRGTAGGRTVSVPARYGLVWLEHQPWRMADAAPPPADPLPFTPLYSPNVVEQRFRAAADRLSRIRFWLDGPPGQRVYIGLSEAEDPENPLHVGMVTLDGRRRGQYYDLSFQPIPQSAGRDYLAWVQAPEAAIDRAVALRIAPGDTAGGRPSLNGYPAPGNLDFATYHHGPPGRWWLNALGERMVPHVFRVRIQQYKPAWLKGGTFGVLLAASGLLALALVMVAWPGTQPWRWQITGIVVLVLAGGWIWEAASGGVIYGGGDGSPEPLPPVDDQPRAIWDALMNEQPASLESARDPVRAEWVAEPSGESDRYALLTTPVRPFKFSLSLPPGSALRFGLLAGGPSARAEVYLEDDLIWQGRAAEAWQQIEVDLSPYARSKARLRLVSEGEAWWGSPHVVSDERWLLSYPLPEERALSPLHVRFGDEVELLGYAMGRGARAKGESVALTLYWKALRPVTRDYTVFLHLVDPDDRMCGAADGFPVAGAFPTSQWPADRVVADEHVVSWTEDVPGPCRPELGLYELETLGRLPAFDAAGRRLPADRVLLDPPISTD